MGCIRYTRHSRMAESYSVVFAIIDMASLRTMIRPPLERLHPLFPTSSAPIWHGSEARMRAQASQDRL